MRQAEEQTGEHTRFVNELNIEQFVGLVSTILMASVSKAVRGPFDLATLKQLRIPGVVIQAYLRATREMMGDIWGYDHPTFPKH